MTLNMKRSFANSASQGAEFRIGGFRHGIGVNLDREQIRTDFVMQVACDAGALFFLDILDLQLKALIALGKVFQPRRHMVEAPRQGCKFRWSLGVEAGAITSIRTLQ